MLSVITVTLLCIENNFISHFPFENVPFYFFLLYLYFTLNLPFVFFFYSDFLTRFTIFLQFLIVYSFLLHYLTFILDCNSFPFSKKFSSFLLLSLLSRFPPFLIYSPLPNVIIHSFASSIIRELADGTKEITAEGRFISVKTRK